MSEQNAGLLEHLADRGDAQPPLHGVELAPAGHVTCPGRIVVTGMGLAAREDQGARGEIDLVMALDHQHFKGRCVA